MNTVNQDNKQKIFHEKYKNKTAVYTPILTRQVDTSADRATPNRSF